MKPVKRIGVLGGSFDPVHIGHLHLAHSALIRCNLDLVLFVPDRLSSYHAPKQHTATFSQRLAMVRRAVSTGNKFVVSTVARAIPGPTYTISVLRALQKKYPVVPGANRSAEWFLITGMDAYASLPQWKDSATLRRECTVVVMSRPGSKCPRRKTAAVIFLHETEIDISSHQLRENLAHGTGKYLLPPGVFDYIVAHGLYGH